MLMRKATMKHYNRLLSFGFAGMIMISPAMADSYEPLPFLYGHYHSSTPGSTEMQPYLEDGKETQNQQWAAEDWYVQDWVEQSESDMALVDGFFNSDIIRSQKIEKGVPTLVVGSNFYRLGGLDKRRVITTIDAVYGITDNGGGPIILKDWKTNAQIGLFTQDGLQIE